MRVLLVLVLGAANVAFGEQTDEDAVETPTIYFNPWTNEAVPEKAPSPQDLKMQRIDFGPLPCSCNELTCGCCARMKLALFNFERRACTNLTYDPYEFAIELNMLMNDESIFKRSVSAKNPPPACIPMPTPLPVLPNVDFCIRLFNVFTPTPGYNLHACVNFETRIQRAPVLVLQFDCVRMGSSGVQLLKPEDNGGLTTSMPTVTQEAEDIYDEVTENKSNSTSALTPTQGNDYSTTSTTVSPSTAVPQATDDYGNFTSSTQASTEGNASSTATLTGNGQR